MSADWSLLPNTASSKPLANCLRKPSSYSLCEIRRFGFALPDHDHSPPHFPQRPRMHHVSGRVPLQLCHPETLVVCRRSAVPTPAVPVPETAVNEHNKPMLWQNNVRPPW